MKKIVVLQTELSGYFISCLKALAKDNEVEVLCVHWPVHLDAPFELSRINNINFISKDSLSPIELSSLIKHFNADLFYVTGWMDKDYRKYSKYFKFNGGKVVMGLDNPWESSIRQWLGVCARAFFIKPYYTYAWVAGYSQYEFARRLGFSGDKILTGLYSADTDIFGSLSEDNLENRSKTVVYVGRFLEWKGIVELYDAFDQLVKAGKITWKLILVGNGELKERLQSTESIEIVDFMQPINLAKLSREAGAFCLPSWRENWGVVVHEFASAGVPLLVSSSVNAAEQFVVNNFNGFVFQGADKNSLQNALIKLDRLSDDDRKVMGSRSKILSYQNSPEIWSYKLKSIL